ncbi:MAG TPA: diadenosine tetraphosphatase [Porticoccaceae bacterium]|nr:diadenosine tetraphosphatase [Porticoccaceae bacterium]
MKVYAVGDIHGCLDGLKSVLAQVNFDPSNDRLIATGDLVNRGPQSLDTLRFCRDLGTSFATVLGNHDLHLLAVARGFRRASRNDMFDALLAASDCDSLLDWLQQQPLLLDIGDYTVVHAGIPPQWSLQTARKLAAEVSTVLCSSRADAYFSEMYGNAPATWSDTLVGASRWRTITNYFTRMRRCSTGGTLEFGKKAALSPTVDPRTGSAAWFLHPDRKCKKRKIIYGHWAALEGRYGNATLFPLDTGYVWGGRLRLMDLDTQDAHHEPKSCESKAP